MRQHSGMHKFHMCASMHPPSPFLTGGWPVDSGCRLRAGCFRAALVLFRGLPCAETAAAAISADATLKAGPLTCAACGSRPSPRTAARCCRVPTTCASSSGNGSEVHTCLLRDGGAGRPAHGLRPYPPFLSRPPSPRRPPDTGVRLRAPRQRVPGTRHAGLQPLRCRLVRGRRPGAQLGEDKPGSGP